MKRFGLRFLFAIITLSALLLFVFSQKPTTVTVRRDLGANSAFTSMSMSKTGYIVNVLGENSDGSYSIVARNLLVVRDERVETENNSLVLYIDVEVPWYRTWSDHDYSNYSWEFVRDTQGRVRKIH